MKHYYAIVACLLVFTTSGGQGLPKQRFSAHSPSETGIGFLNTITESGQYNHIAWENIYHGAGVAIGDLNNDGLPDLFFSGNQNPDRLYLNKGDFQFEDMTENLNVDTPHYWSSGVTMVDINSDGFLDIYVSKSGLSLSPLDRRNQLFINNGDLTFTEQASTYGLDNDGYSMQTAFFDFDKDGDLDAYIMNQPPSTQQEKMRDRVSRQPCNLFTDRLLRNDLNKNGKFTDVTYLSKVSNCAYGLGLSIADFNGDGWDDIYVANDYFASDNLYINQQDGTFIDEANSYFNHQSLYAMGCDVGDFNNDGLMDLVTADMSAISNYRGKANMPSMNVQRFRDIIDAGFGHQYMFNTLQMNRGNGHFSEIAQLSGIANTDWTWGMIWMDADNDMDLDLFATNGIKKEVRNVDALNNLRQQLKDGVIKLSEILSITPSEKLTNFAFNNLGNLQFEEAKDWGFDHTGFSSGVAYGDLDADGDLDLVVSNVDDPPSIYENHASLNYLRIQLKGIGQNIWALGAKVELQFPDQRLFREQRVVRGYQSSSEPVMHFGLGKANVVPILTVTWPDGTKETKRNIKSNQLITLRQGASEQQATVESVTEAPVWLSKDHILSFNHTEKNYDDFESEVLLPYKMSQLGPAMAQGDINNDGLEDFYIGGASGQSGQLYVQCDKGFKAMNLPSDANYEEIGAAFLDVNGDGHQDLYVASGSNEFDEGDRYLQDRIFLGDGKGYFTKNPDALPEMRTSTQVIAPVDFDQDGDLDLLVGGRVKQHAYPLAPRSYLLENRGGTYHDVTREKAPELYELGMITGASWYRDKGQLKLMLVGEWMPVTVMKWTGSSLKSIKKKELTNTIGLWQSLTASDIDQDGDMDFFLGNLGLNSKFKKDETHQFHIYADDFDENGSLDIVLGKESDGDLVPVRGRQCSSQQMPFIKSKYPTYHEFAQSSLIDIYSEQKLENSFHRSLDFFESIYLINENGSLQMKQMPLETQVSPVMSSVFLDIDRDGQDELILFGNLYETEVETTRLDGSFGQVLEWTGEGFEAIPGRVSGVALKGNSKSAIGLKGKWMNYVIVGMNNGPVELLKTNRMD